MVHLNILFSLDMTFKGRQKKTLRIKLFARTSILLELELETFNYT